jgi:biotin carboxyl carrier protein
MDEFGPLKDLIRAFNQSTFTHYVVGGEGVRIHLRQRPRTDRKAAGADHSKPHLEHRPVKVTVHDTGKTILSPRVGHFFPLRNQHGELALKGGEMIEEGQAFGLVESMNLKYEIRADKSGLVDQYLIEDGEAVEFGQPLILLK